MKELLYVNDEFVDNYFLNRQDFLIISTYDYTKSQEENDALHQQLRKDLNVANFSFMEFFQIFDEGINSLQLRILYITNLPKGNNKVSNELKDEALIKMLGVDLCKKYKQAIFLYKSGSNSLKSIDSKGNEVLIATTNTLSKEIKSLLLPAHISESKLYVKRAPASMMSRHALYLKTGEEFIGPNTLKEIQNL